MNKNDFIRLHSSINVPKKKRIYNLKIEKLPESQLDMIEIAQLRAAFPNRVDLRSKMPPIIDQGELGSCTAAALCGVVGYLDPKLTGSILFLYYNERVIEGTIPYDAGAYIHTGVNSLKKTGICEQKLWPYDISKFAIKPPNNCYTDALKHKALTVKNIKNDIYSMKSALLAGHPFAVGIQLHSSFESDYVTRTGIVKMPLKDDNVLGGHAVVCVGYVESKKCWIMRNSWGRGWGDKGYFYLPFEYLTSNNLTSDLWCITSFSKPKAPVTKLKMQSNPLFLKKTEKLSAISIPTSYDLRTIQLNLNGKNQNRMPKAYNQKILPTCEANAVAALFKWVYPEFPYSSEDLPYNTGKDFKYDPSRIMLYQNSVLTRVKRAMREDPDLDFKETQQKYLLEGVLLDSDILEPLISEGVCAEDYTDSSINISYEYDKMANPYDIVDNTFQLIGDSVVPFPLNNQATQFAIENWSNKIEYFKINTKPITNVLTNDIITKIKSIISTNPKTNKSPGYPVMMGINVDTLSAKANFTNPERNDLGEYFIPIATNISQLTSAGHQVCIVGYNDNKIFSYELDKNAKTKSVKTLQGFFIVRNSWGDGNGTYYNYTSKSIVDPQDEVGATPGWGMNGYAYLPYQFLLTPGLVTQGTDIVYMKKNVNSKVSID